MVREFRLLLCFPVILNRAFRFPWAAQLWKLLWSQIEMSFCQENASEAFTVASEVLVTLKVKKMIGNEDESAS